jgi:hypothetical protein
MRSIMYNRSRQYKGYCTAEHKQETEYLIRTKRKSSTICYRVRGSNSKRGIVSTVLNDSSSGDGRESGRARLDRLRDIVGETRAGSEDDNGSVT